MSYLSEDQLREMGFKHLVKGVQISDRASIYDAEQIEIGDYSRIDDFCAVSGKVTIGRNVHIAVSCTVAGGEKGIVFEDFSGLAYGGRVFSQSDDYSGRALTNPTVPDEYKRETKKAVHIGRHCIIGANSVVFPGVTLREGTSVGSVSMVVKSTEEWSVYFGIPAVRLRARKKNMLELEAKYLAENSDDQE